MMKSQDFSVLERKARQLTHQCGVYLFQDRVGKVLYVGKAKNLKKRVQQYFQKAPHSPKITWLLKQAKNIEVMIAQNEMEALLLENTLIKKYTPPFNVRLKDDKTYPFVKIDFSVSFPRLEWTRTVQNKKKDIRYFGPFPSVKEARIAIQLLQEMFLLRDCNENVFRYRKRPCLLYEMKHCSAPCVGYVTEKEYQKQLSQAIQVLEGRGQLLLKMLYLKMERFSQEQAFEQAAFVRDQIQGLKQILKKQNVVQLGDRSHIDVVVVMVENVLSSNKALKAHAVVLEMRFGKWVGIRHFHIQNKQAEVLSSDRELIREVLLQIFLKNQTSIDLLVAYLPQEKKLLEKALGRNIRVARTQKEQALIELALKNVPDFSKTTETEAALKEVQKKLHLLKMPFHMECYDVSHFQGEACVGSRVVFIEGKPEKSLYRHYLIRGPGKKGDDFESMKEILSRRFLKKEDPFPDLVVLDGGKGQLHQVSKVFDDLEIQNVALCALAKSRIESGFQKKEIQRSLERIYIPGRKNPIFLKPSTGSFQLLTALRDEAHRFAITFHRYRKRKKTLKNP